MKGWPFPKSYRKGKIDSKRRSKILSGNFLGNSSSFLRLSLKTCSQLQYLIGIPRLGYIFIAVKLRHCELKRHWKWSCGNYKSLNGATASMPHRWLHDADPSSRHPIICIYASAISDERSQRQFIEALSVCKDPQQRSQVAIKSVSSRPRVVTWPLGIQCHPDHIRRRFLVAILPTVLQRSPCVDSYASSLPTADKPHRPTGHIYQRLSTSWIFTHWLIMYGNGYSYGLIYYYNLDNL